MTPALLLLALTASPQPVTQVVVYPDRARVTRATSVACGPAVLAEFSEGLPAAADPATLRAAVPGTEGAEIRGLWTEVRTRADAFAPAARALETQIRELEKQRAAAADVLVGHDEAVALAAAYLRTTAAALGRELADPPHTLAAWQKGLSGPLDSQLTELLASVAARAALRELDRKLAELRAKAAKLAEASQRRERIADVLVSCPAGRDARVELSYVVGGASWAPVYEARAEPAAGRVLLSAYATIQQATGEDWRGARVTLSTASPLANATPPEIEPLSLATQEREYQKKVLATRTEAAAHAEAGPGGGGKNAGLAARDQGLSVQLDVPDPADVSGDGTPVRVFVAKQALTARFANRCAPALAPFVFRVTDLTDDAPFPLLPGQVESFWRGGFVGRQPIERVAQGAVFHLTFGIDETYKVEREVLEEVEREKGLFGSARRFKYGYRITLGSYGKRAEGRASGVELTEQIPVSEIDDVRVTVDPNTAPGYELAAQDGRLTWKLEPAPGEPRVLELHFHVDVPGSYDAEGL
jgi:uncharacterized protein (TIGR02231 family)